MEYDHVLSDAKTVFLIQQQRRLGSFGLGLSTLKFIFEYVRFECYEK